MPFPDAVRQRLLDLLMEEYGHFRGAEQLRVMETWPEVVVYRDLRTGRLNFERGVTQAEDEHRDLVFVAR